MHKRQRRLLRWRAKKKDNAEETQDRVDISEFNFLLNSDVHCGQVPQTEDEKAEWIEDEKNVKAVCSYLTEHIIPELVSLFSLPSSTYSS